MPFSGFMAVDFDSCINLVKVHEYRHGVLYSIINVRVYMSLLCIASNILKVQNNRTLFCTFVYTKVINLYEN